MTAVPAGGKGDLLNTFKQKIDSEDPKTGKVFTEFVKKVESYNLSEQEIIEGFIETNNTDQKLVDEKTIEPRSYLQGATSLGTKAVGTLLGTPLDLTTLFLKFANYPEFTEEIEKDYPQGFANQITDNLNKKITNAAGWEPNALRPQTTLQKVLDRGVEFAANPLNLLPAGAAAKTALAGTSFLHGIADYGLENYVGLGPKTRFALHLGAGYGTSKVAQKLAKNRQYNSYVDQYDPYIRDQTSGSTISVKDPLYQEVKNLKSFDPNAGNTTSRINRPGRTPPSVFTTNTKIGKIEEKALATQNAKAMSIYRDYTADISDAFQKNLDNISQNEAGSAAFSSEVEQAASTVNDIFTDQQHQLVDQATNLANETKPTIKAVDQFAALNKRIQSFSEKYSVDHSLTGGISKKMADVSDRLLYQDNPAIPEAEAANLQQIRDHNAKVDLQQQAYDAADKVVVEYKKPPPVRQNPLVAAQQKIHLGKPVNAQVLGRETQSHLRLEQKTSRKNMALAYDSLKPKLSKEIVNTQNILDVVNDKIAALETSGMDTSSKNRALQPLHKLRDAISIGDKKLAVYVPRQISAQNLSQITKDFSTNIDWNQIETGNVNLYDINEALHDTIRNSIKSDATLKDLEETTKTAHTHYETFRNKNYIRKLLNSQTPEKELAALGVGENYDATELALGKNSDKFTPRIQRYLFDQAFPGQKQEITNSEYQSVAGKVRSARDTKNFLSKLSPEIQSDLEQFLNSAHEEIKIGVKSERPATAKELPQVEKQLPLPKTKLPLRISKGMPDAKDYMDEFNHVLTLQDNLPDKVIANKNAAKDLEQISFDMVQTAREVYGDAVADKMVLMRDNYMDQLITNEVVQVAMGKEQSPVKLLRKMSTVGGLQTVEKAFNKFPNGTELFNSLRRRKFEQQLNLPKNASLKTEDFFKLNILFKKEEAEYFKALLGDKIYNDLKQISTSVGRIRENIKLFANTSKTAFKINDELALFKYIGFFKSIKSAAITAAATVFNKAKASLYLDEQFVEHLRELSQDPKNIDPEKASQITSYLAKTIKDSINRAAKATPSASIPALNVKDNEEEK